MLHRELQQSKRLGGLELRRLAHDAEHGDAIAADVVVESEELFGARPINLAIGRKGVGAMGKTPAAVVSRRMIQAFVAS